MKMREQANGYPASYSSQYGNYAIPSDTLLTLEGIYGWINWAFLIIIVVVAYNVRVAVRAKYSIPNTDCKGTPGMEDCCCAFWCAKCSTAQMLRHTGDYENKTAMCCTDTGLQTV